ncbi:MAG: prepilin-type N-terminal cleavage/methylation domain-containing protein, partial [Kiritimatiellae bacterium]|nr:prepilin-type N-terminal cleavage/methylation domain-containing protein [Kiritimatiellia bacterium]
MKTIPKRRSQAFSTVELMIVIAIIGTLATLAIPSFARANMESKLSRTKNDLRVLFDAFNLYAIEYGNYPGAGGGGNYYTEALAAPAPLAEFL